MAKSELSSMEAEGDSAGPRLNLLLEFEQGRRNLNLATYTDTPKAVEDCCGSKGPTCCSNGRLNGIASLMW